LDQEKRRRDGQSSCKTMGLYKLDLKRTNPESYRGVNVNIIGLPK